MTREKYNPVIQTLTNVLMFTLIYTYILFILLISRIRMNLFVIQIVSFVFSSYLYTFVFINEYGDNYLSL